MGEVGCELELIVNWVVPSGLVEKESEKDEGRVIT